MFGDYNNIIVYVLDSISKGFTDLSCKISEILDGLSNDRSRKSRVKQAFFIIIGALFIFIYAVCWFLYGIYRVIFSNGKGRISLRNNIKTKELLSVLVLCFILFLSIALLWDSEYVKDTNLYYFDCRNDINESCKYELPSVNSSEMNTYVYHLRNVLECKTSSNEVNRIRKHIDDRLPQEVNFATINDYLITLLSLEQFDILDELSELEYFTDTYNKSDFQLFYGYLLEACKESFYNGKFYSSDVYLELLMKFVDYNSISNFPRYNNSFYLMRLFNEEIIDRYRSCHHNNNLLAKIVEDVDYINDIVDNIGFNSPISSHEGEIITYLNLVSEFNKIYQNEVNMTDKFLKLNADTKSYVIKQFSLNMALRTQYDYTYWLKYYNDASINSNLLKLKKIQNQCMHEITYPFLLNTLDLYSINNLQ